MWKSQLYLMVMQWSAAKWNQRHSKSLQRKCTSSAPSRTLRVANFQFRQCGKRVMVAPRGFNSIILPCLLMEVSVVLFTYPYVFFLKRGCFTPTFESEFYCVAQSSSEFTI